MDEPTTIKPEPIWLDKCDDEEDDEENDSDDEDDDDVIEEIETDPGQQDEIPDPRQFLQVDIKLEPELLKSEESFQDFGDDDDYDDATSENQDEDPVTGLKRVSFEQPRVKQLAGDKSTGSKPNKNQLNEILSGGNKLEHFGYSGRRVNIIPWCERPFVCSVCGRRFSQRSGLKSHMYTHTGEKPYSCPQCHRSFSHRTHVTRHMLTHTGLKPHSCSLCSRKFSLRSNLIKHMVTHSGEKPYTCVQCNRSFAQRFNLNTHMSTHTREKPYACTQCSRKYSHRSSLTKHVLTHTTMNHSDS